MAFGVKREELNRWKQAVKRGEIAFLTHYWLDDRFPEARTVTKAGCADIDKLVQWGAAYGLKKNGSIRKVNFLTLIYWVRPKNIFWNKKT